MADQPNGLKKMSDFTIEEKKEIYRDIVVNVRDIKTAEVVAQKHSMLVTAILNAKATLTRKGVNVPYTKSGPKSFLTLEFIEELKGMLL